MIKKLSFALLLTALVATASAGNYKLPKDEPIATVTFPDSWKIEASDEALDANSDDNSVYVNLEFNDSDSLDGAIDETIGFLKKNKVTVDKATEKKDQGDLNGIKVVSISWDGEDSEGKCKIALAVLAVTPKKALLLTYWVSPEGEQKHAEEIGNMLASIKPLAK